MLVAGVVGSGWREWRRRLGHLVKEVSSNWLLLGQFRLAAGKGKCPELLVPSPVVLAPRSHHPDMSHGLLAAVTVAAGVRHQPVGGGRGRADSLDTPSLRHVNVASNLADTSLLGRMFNKLAGSLLPKVTS